MIKAFFSIPLKQALLIQKPLTPRVVTNIAIIVNNKQQKIGHNNNNVGKEVTF
tara:strand:- start:480 stop:638 length:159 start_codon:yes stop_codon:yes gene_type:complete